jgi:hypothetical protein
MPLVEDVSTLEPDFRSIMCGCDNTGESLAFKVRAGSAGSNTVADHIEVLDQAIAQIPAQHRRNLLITVDGAGSSHGLVDHISTLNARPRIHAALQRRLGPGRPGACRDRPSPHPGLAAGAGRRR